MKAEFFNPLDKRNLGISIADAVFRQDAHPLKDLQAFNGAGVYAIYYNGDFPLYDAITQRNRDAFVQPIYVGKAVPSGARKGGFDLDGMAGEYLFKRLGDHKKSIESAEILTIDYFHCRFLLLDDIWIHLGESLLIEKTRPLWNIVLDGFGNHDSGGGRYNQQRSAWDIMHPGRKWAEKLKEGKEKEEIAKTIVGFLEIFSKAA